MRTTIVMFLLTFNMGLAQVIDYLPYELPNGDTIMGLPYALTEYTDDSLFYTMLAQTQALDHLIDVIDNNVTLWHSSTNENLCKITPLQMIHTVQHFRNQVLEIQEKWNTLKLISEGPLLESLLFSDTLVSFALMRVEDYARRHINAVRGATCTVDTPFLRGSVIFMRRIEYVLNTHFIPMTGLYLLHYYDQI